MKSNPTTYYSNGKLLLTAEYLVLDGALALAVPTQFGQDLQLTPIAEPKIYWKSWDEKKHCWFERSFSLPLTESSLPNPLAENLRLILYTASQLNPNFLSDKKGFIINTFMSFPRNWGLGSSSTLINNIAKWAEIDAFELLQKTLGGSGYDIACAQNDTPIIYQLLENNPLIKTVDFYPDFSEQLYFIHLNKKQKSNIEITRYQDIKKGIPEAVPTVSEITNLIISTSKLDDFEKLIFEHEKLLASILQLPTVQEIYFKDYFGQTKSLGAWGGDFILATGNDDTPKYFRNKGFETVLLYDEMVKKND